MWWSTRRNLIIMIIIMYTPVVKGNGSAGCHALCSDWLPPPVGRGRKPTCGAETLYTLWFAYIMSPNYASKRASIPFLQFEPRNRRKVSLACLHCVRIRLRINKWSQTSPCRGEPGDCKWGVTLQRTALNQAFCASGWVVTRPWPNWWWTLRRVGECAIDRSSAA